LRSKSLIALAVTAVLVAGMVSTSAGSPRTAGGAKVPSDKRHSSRLPKGYVPLIARSVTSRYFVKLKAPSVAERINTSGRTARTQNATAQRQLQSSVESTQSAAIGAVESLGGKVLYRYDKLVNAFSASLTLKQAEEVAARPDVETVSPVGITRKLNETSVPFIGATKVQNELNVKGQGMRVAVVDDGIDYTHANFGGPGTVEAYESNDRTIIEPGTFPTNKVIGGFDFVGDDYDVLDDDPANDTPVPDRDPLAENEHGTHTSGTCCGNGVPFKIGRGVAPKSKIYMFKVWDEGNSTEDVLVQAYEAAMDPNDDGSMRDAVDVLSFSGGVDYGTKDAVESQAAQAVVDLGTVFVASAGNSSNQPAGGSGYITGTPATAPGVISVAASIDSTLALLLEVNTPPGVELPFEGVLVHQDWSEPITSDITGDVVDAREFFPPADPSGAPSSGDQQFCTGTGGADLSGKIALIFKGSTADGDCAGSDKVANAATAGADAVILWSGFPGPPFLLAGDTQPIPAVMVAGADGDALGAAASPDAPGSFNTGDLNVTINSDAEEVDTFADWLADFTSEGPARVTNALKPDISAPGVDITSSLVGSGDGALTISGTSMAAPHVSGVATLLRQIHPRWGPARIKAAIMNQATRKTFDTTGGSPVSATIMGSGRVQAFDSAVAETLATPGSLSFGLHKTPGLFTQVQRITVRNLGNLKTYRVSGNERYMDYDPSVVGVKVGFRGGNLGRSVSFTLRRGQKRNIFVELSVDPSGISEPEQEFGWFAFNGNMDGVVRVVETRGGRDKLGVPWHVVPLAASNDKTTKGALDLSGGSDELGISHSGAGISQADFYLLGATDARETSLGEADVTRVGARSFAGEQIDGNAEGLPDGTDPLVGIGYIDFLTNGDAPTELVEFGVRTSVVRNTLESSEITVAIDSGNDGVFADPQLSADYLLVKPQGFGDVCVFDFSIPDPFADCSATYFSDYSFYNANVIGMPADAGAIGLSDAEPDLGYQVTACTGLYTGDVPVFECDTVGELVDGSYTMSIDTTDPALVVNPLVCGGFWGGADCSAAGSVDVSVGSAAPGDNPSLLVLFPHNRYSRSSSVVTTSTP